MVLSSSGWVAIGSASLSGHFYHHDMTAAVPPLALAELTGQLRGQLHTGATIRQLYATDASAYQQTPLAVAIPKSVDDLVRLVEFAGRHDVGLIPRTAGTSLAGQVVGDGIVVDVSRPAIERFATR